MFIFFFSSVSFFFQFQFFYVQFFIVHFFEASLIDKICILRFTLFTIHIFRRKKIRYKRRNTNTRMRIQNIGIHPYAHLTSIWPTLFYTTIIKINYIYIGLECCENVTTIHGGLILLQRMKKMYFESLEFFFDL